MSRYPQVMACHGIFSETCRMVGSFCESIRFRQSRGYLMEATKPFVPLRTELDLRDVLDGTFSG